MGFFDRFKKKENNNMPTNQPQTDRKPYDISYSSGSNGTLQIDFYDRNADFKQFYDTTRLVIFSQSTLAGQMVQNCAVSWYGSNDCLMMDKARGTFVNGRAEEYSYVMTQLDLNLLQNDPEYCSVVMKQLLNQKRVRTYLEKGLQEAPDIPCGEYIGGVMRKDEGYRKFFSAPVGQASHYSSRMKSIRENHRASLEASKQREIAAKQAQIAKLQSEIDNMR